MSDELLTDREVAPLFRISWEQVQQRCLAGQWQHTRIGRQYLFSADDIAAIRALCKVVPKETPADTWGHKTRGKS